MYGLFLSHQFKLGVAIFSLIYLGKIVKKRSKSPLKIIVGDIKHLLLFPGRTVSLLLFLSSSSIVFSAYTSVKSTIGAIFPFKYDELFYSLDKYIHFGYSPWEITHSLFSHPLASFTINFLYNIWFLLVFLGLILIYLRQDKCRHQYLLTYFFTWLVTGGIGAIALASAGPCFSEALLDVSWYDELFERLQVQHHWLQTHFNMDLWALTTQASLWDSHMDQAISLGGGVSAMPSMHVATTTVMALGARSINRYLGYAAIIYLICIQIGSVHLGWHYAIDGYVSILVTLGLWKVFGSILALVNHRRQKLLYNTAA
jgi:hypothetical protein